MRSEIDSKLQPSPHLPLLLLLLLLLLAELCGPCSPPSPFALSSLLAFDSPHDSVGFSRESLSDQGGAPRFRALARFVSGSFLAESTEGLAKVRSFPQYVGSRDV
ncbi:hypothetical protein NL676_019302 [Syzygium grande]|nr:hypothetical protein NL676_019302 [Syzygium grande]